MKLVITLTAATLFVACAHQGDKKSADTLVVNAKIYVADEARTIASAMAVRDGEIVFVGDEAGAGAFEGTATTIIDAGGKLVLPGLHDAHLHPISAMPIETCSLDNKPHPLAEIAVEAAACITRVGAAPGTPLAIYLWNYSSGNQPDATLKTIRQALDRASSSHPIILFGSDGHHYGANSAALARGKNHKGATIGLSARTLKTDFMSLSQYVGVDTTGEPNGRLTEDYALAAIGIEDWLAADTARRRAAPELMMAVTLPRGITSFLDAAADPSTLDIYDSLEKSGNLKGRATLALFFDPNDYKADTGAVDFSALINDASAIRAKYQSSSRIKANFLKLFADGVMEGDPLAVPPTLPNAALSRDYLQPIFEWDPNTNWVKVAGYVDSDSQACSESPIGVEQFRKRHGFHPAQCARNAGVLQHDEQVILDYIAAGSLAGFKFNIHAIGDRAVKTALDGIERAQLTKGARNHIVTHLQLIRPEDVARFAPLGAFASMTFAWAVIDPQYDTTVFPFIDRADGVRGLYNPDAYYYRNAYPAASLKAAGAVLIAGSDAPVDTIDPRPFVNIEAAVSRRIAERLPLNAAQAISIEDAIDAYTINAARALEQEAVVGSLEVGKRADFIIIDQDILHLASAGMPEKISETRVLETWFDGEKVFKLAN